MDTVTRKRRAVYWLEAKKSIDFGLSATVVGRGPWAAVVDRNASEFP